MKNIQINPVEEFKIPIDLVTKTAMTISLNGAEEKTSIERIPVIPAGITTDQILKMAIKSNNFSFRNLKITPQNPNITTDDIIEMGVNVNLFGTKTVYKSLVDGHILDNSEICAFLKSDQMDKMQLESVAIVPETDEVDISEIIRDGIKKVIKAFEELPIKPLDDNITDQDIINEAINAGLFKFEEITVGTGEFKTSTKSVALYDSRKRNLQNNVSFSVNSPNDTHLGEFDYAVANACITDRLHGNFYTTPNRIFHLLGGGLHLYPHMRAAIMASLERLASVRVKIAIDETAMKKGVIPKDQQDRFFQRGTYFEFNGYLLPSESLTLTINGKTVDAIHLLQGGAIMANSQARNQIATSDVNLMQPPVRTTENTVAINHYLLRRSKEIIGSNDPNRKHFKKLRNIITFEDMYKRIGIADGSRKQKFDARKIALKILDFFVENNLITGYTENEKNGYPYSITINF